MTGLHANSTCERHRFQGHGRRRRRCAACGLTVTVRPKRRGRKRRVRVAGVLRRTFVDRLTLVQQARIGRARPDAVRWKLGRGLDRTALEPWPHGIPPGPLIIVIDGIWLEARGEPVTAYLMALRPTGGDEAVFLRPVILPGHESQERWREAVSTVPPEALGRICAMVADGFSGSAQLAWESRWRFQLCQAHLLRRLGALCGDYKFRVSWRDGRRQARAAIHAAFAARDERTAAAHARALARPRLDPDCPAAFRPLIRSTLAHLPEYRACHRFPELRLPATTNTVENMNGRIRALLGRCRGLRTADSLTRWIVAFIRFHPRAKCRPKNLHI